MTHIFTTLTWMAAGISSIYPTLSPSSAPSSLTFLVFFITFHGELPQAKSFLNLCLFFSLSRRIISRSYWLTFLVKFEQTTCIHLLCFRPRYTTCVHFLRPPPWDPALPNETPSRLTRLHQTFNRHCHRGLDHLTLVQNFPGPSHWLRGEDTYLWWLLLPSWHHANILIAHVNLSWWPRCCPSNIPHLYLPQGLCTDWSFHLDHCPSN